MDVAIRPENRNPLFKLTRQSFICLINARILSAAALSSRYTNHEFDIYLDEERTSGGSAPMDVFELSRWWDKHVVEEQETQRQKAKRLSVVKVKSAMENLNNVRRRLATDEGDMFARATALRNELGRATTRVEACNGRLASASRKAEEARTCLANVSNARPTPQSIKVIESVRSEREQYEAAIAESQIELKTLEFNLENARVAYDRCLSELTKIRDELAVTDQHLRDQRRELFGLYTFGPLHG